MAGGPRTGVLTPGAAPPVAPAAAGEGGQGVDAPAVDAFLEEICAALRRGHSVSLRGFGSFYVRPERESWVFRFNPAQRLRALLGWSSTSRGPR
jgi:DNA-binding protein HU-beta